MGPIVRKMFLSACVVGVVAGMGTVAFTALAAPNTFEVAADDPVMFCRGPEVPPGATCRNSFAKEISAELYTEESKRYTKDEVVGCNEGNQPAIGRATSWSKGSEIAFGGGLTADYFKAGVTANVTTATTVTRTAETTVQIPANYGKITWGMFAQHMVRSTQELTVTVSISGPEGSAEYHYHARGVIVNKPQTNDSGAAAGAHSPGDRNFANLAEFQKLCKGAGAVPPPYLR